MHIQPLPRRRFLKFLSLAPASMSILSVNLRADDLNSLGINCQIFNSSQLDVFIRYGQILFPSDETFPRKIDREAIQRIDEEIFFVKPKIQKDIKLALDLFEYLPITYGYFSRFSKLEVNQRLEFLTELEKTKSSTVSLMNQGIRALLLSCYYGHEDSWQAIDYSGPFAGIPEKLSAQRQTYKILTENK